MGVAVGARGPRQVDAEREPAGLSSTTLLIGIVIAGAAIRFSTLGEQSFWYDEATTYGIVAHGLGHVLSQVPKTESTPYLYYVLLWLWAQVFGHSEVGLRSFSALCGTLTIPVVWAVGRRLFSERVGLVVALVTAVNPFLFWYSQEARSYSLLVLLSALSMLALVRTLEVPSRGRVLAWGLISAVALASHYFAAFVLVPEAVWLLVALHRRGELTFMKAALGCGPIVLVAAALAPLAIHQNDGRAGYIARMGGTLAHRLAQLAKQDLIGDGQPHKAVLAAIGCLVVLVAVVLVLWRTGRAERDAAALPIAVAGGGILLAALAAAGGTDYLDSRNMLPTWPALALVVAAGLGAARAGWPGALGVAAISVLSLYCISNIVLDSRWQRDDWRGAAHAVGPAPATSPRVLVADRYQGLVSLQPYLSGVGSFPAAGAPLREVDVVWLQRGAYGNSIMPVAPIPLPGFARRELRTATYIVVRYRASTPVVETPATLAALYPIGGEGTVLLQKRSS